MLELWALVECDLHDVYGIDLGDADLLTSRSWPWLRTRVTGLLSTDTRLSRALGARLAAAPPAAS